MTTISRQDIDAAAEAIGLDEDDYGIRSDYSGRNMYGRTCAGVTLPGSRVFAFTAALALVMAEQGREDDALEIAEQAGTDSMGLGTLLYWPGVTLAD